MKWLSQTAGLGAGALGLLMANWICVVWGPLVCDLDASLSQQKYKYQRLSCLRFFSPQILKCWTKNICPNVKMKPLKVPCI